MVAYYESADVDVAWGEEEKYKFEAEKSEAAANQRAMNSELETHIRIEDNLRNFFFKHSGQRYEDFVTTDLLLEFGINVKNVKKKQGRIRKFLSPEIGKRVIFYTANDRMMILHQAITFFKALGGFKLGETRLAPAVTTHGS